MSAGPLLFTAVLLLCSSASAAALPAAHTTAAGDSAPCRPRMRLFLFGPEGCLQLGDSLRLPDSLWLESLERLRKQLSELPQLLEQRMEAGVRAEETRAVATLAPGASEIPRGGAPAPSASAGAGAARTPTSARTGAPCTGAATPRTRTRTGTATPAPGIPAPSPAGAVAYL
jgi:hypothetical protein